MQDVVADTTAEFARLAARGRPHFWLIKPLARYTGRRRTAGRWSGTATNKADLLSHVPRGEAHVVGLDGMAEVATEAWRTAVADCRRTDPAEAAAFRVDFEAWLASLSYRHRDAAKAFINYFFSDAAAQGGANFAAETNYDPANLKSIELMGDVDEAARATNPDNWNAMRALDVLALQDQQAEIVERWQEWISQ